MVMEKRTWRRGKWWSRSSRQTVLKWWFGKELTLRAEEAGLLRTFTDTTGVGESGWEPPLVDEDWHAICQAIFQGVEGSERETMHYKFAMSFENLSTCYRPIFTKIPQIRSNTFLFLKNFLFKYIFITEKLSPARKAKCRFYSLDEFQGRLPSGSVLPLV